MKVAAPAAILTTKRLILRPFREEDDKDVFAYAKDDETTRYLTWPAHRDVAESAWAIRTFFLKPGVWAICKAEDEVCIGCIELRMGNDPVDFGYVLHKDQWNRGYMTEALEAVLEEAFRHLCLKKVTGAHEQGNNASASVMRKCGMHWFARKDHVQVSPVKFADMEYYEITEEQWNADRRRR